MSRSLSKFLRHPFWSLASIALAALAPKCAVCMLAYAGIGAVLGLGSPLVCGSAAGSPSSWELSLMAFAVALGIAGLLAGFRSTSCQNFMKRLLERQRATK
jgi:hypothetical protein